MIAVPGWVPFEDTEVKKPRSCRAGDSTAEGTDATNDREGRLFSTLGDHSLRLMPPLVITWGPLRSSKYEGPHQQSPIWT